MKVAALDLGTNSFLCLILEKKGSDEFHVIEDKAVITRLGQSVQKEGRIAKEALMRAAQAFGQFQTMIEKHQISQVLAVTTSAARDAENFEELKSLGKEYNIPIEVISGEEEAELSFKGAIQDERSSESLLLDIGGGSTELAFFHEERDFHLKSLAIGSVRMGEMFVEDWEDLKATHLEKIKDQILKTLDLSWGEERPPEREWVAVAGTPTSLKAMELKGFDPDLIEGSRLSLSTVKSQVNHLIHLGLSERRKLEGLDPKRADVIPVGAVILETLMEWAGLSEVKVSVKGLRYGLAKRLLNEEGA